MISKKIKQTWVKSKTPKLYWVTDCYDDENWFVLADSERTAKKFYGNEKGLVASEIEEPEFLMDCPIYLFKKFKDSQMIKSVPCCPSLLVLKSLGFHILPFDNCSKLSFPAVEYKGRKFQMGMADYDQSRIQKISENVFVYENIPKSPLNKHENKNTMLDFLNENLNLFWVSRLSMNESPKQWFVIADMKETALKFCNLTEGEKADGCEVEALLNVPFELFQKYYKDCPLPIQAQSSILMELGMNIVSENEDLELTVEYQGRNFKEVFGRQEEFSVLFE